MIMNKLNEYVIIGRNIFNGCFSRFVEVPVRFLHGFGIFSSGFRCHPIDNWFLIKGGKHVGRNKTTASSVLRVLWCPAFCKDIFGRVYSQLRTCRGVVRCM